METEKMEKVTGIFINPEGNVNGLSKDHLEVIVNALGMSVHGFETVKDQSISEQKAAFRKLGEPYDKLSSAELMTEIKLFLEQGKKASEVFYAIKGWQKEQSDLAELKALDK